MKYSTVSFITLSLLLANKTHTMEKEFLLSAVKNGDNGNITMLLNKFPQLHSTRDKDGKDLFQLCPAKSVSALLEGGYHHTQRDDDGNTMMMQCLINSDDEKLKAVIAWENSDPKNRSTVLLSNKEKVTVRDIFDYLCKTTWNPWSIEILLTHKKFDVNGTDNNGDTILHKMANPQWKAKKELMRLMNKNSTTKLNKPLNAQVVKRILKNGGDFQLRNKNSETPLDLALQNNVLTSLDNNDEVWHQHRYFYVVRGLPALFLASKRKTTDSRKKLLLDILVKY